MADVQLSDVNPSEVPTDATHRFTTDARNTKVDALPAVSALNTALAAKADLVAGKVPLNQSADLVTDSNFFKGAETDNHAGDATWLQNNPVGSSTNIFTLNISAIAAAINALGNSGTLGSPTVSFGTVTASSIIVNWTAVTNATSYTVKRNTSNTQTGATTIYTGNLLTYTDTSLTASTQYYYFVIPTASGYTNGTAGTGNTTTSASSGGGSAEFLTSGAATSGVTESPSHTFNFAANTDSIVFAKKITGDGRVYFNYQNNAYEKEAAFGFDTNNTQETWYGSSPNYAYYVILGQSQIVPGNMGGTFTGDTSPAVGNLYGLDRTGGTVSVIKSTDGGTTFTTHYTFTGTSTGDLYIKGSGLNNQVGAILVDGKGVGLVTA